MPSKKISFDKMSEKIKALKLESTSITRIILVKDVSDFFKHSYRFFFTFIFVSHPPSSSAHFYRSFSGFLREQKKKMGEKMPLMRTYILSQCISFHRRIVLFICGMEGLLERGGVGRGTADADETNV